MQLYSTKNHSLKSSWAEAVLKGLAPDGGLFLPDSFPRFKAGDWSAFKGLSFPEICFQLSRGFLHPEVSDQKLLHICSDAFTFPAPLHALSENTYILELFHGPTCAFKDFGARFMARLFRHFLGEHSLPLTVLVATSGDTGSAVANAFLDTSSDPLIRVAILYPKGKVSLIQEKQMTTLGHNVFPFELDGSFDDCQSLVKQALRDPHLNSTLRMTSANSINIARLLPQLFYYVEAAIRLPLLDQPIFVVPSGNLGNLAGGLMAHRMGMPAKHFIAACNQNDPFPEYLRTGSYRARPSSETLSNAMDVGDPSNFSRICSMYENDIDLLRKDVSGEKVSDEETLSTISKTYQSHGYILDPHTAVGLQALENYRALSKSIAPAIVLATAHPAKFETTVKRAIGKSPTIPAQLSSALRSKEKKVPLKNSLSELREHLLHLPSSRY